MRLLLISLFALLLNACAGAQLRGTGDLGLIIERASGHVTLINTTARQPYARIGGLGDLSHASAVYSRDGRYAYIFGRDGGLTKIDLLEAKIVKRIIQSGNAIGGSISQDGRIVVGLADLSGNRFAYALFDGGEIRVTDFSNPRQPKTQRFPAGSQPYDGLVTPDGRYFLAGLFGEDGVAMLDLWQPEKGAKKILENYGRGQEKLPVFKMPHLRGWSVAQGKAYLPAIGRHEVLVVDVATWKEVGRIPVRGQPVFVMARPDGRQIWVNFAFPDNAKVDVIDTLAGKVVHAFEPGKGILHMEFAPRGENVWLSARDDNKVLIYNTENFAKLGEIPAESPSGIFFTSRAVRIGF